MTADMSLESLVSSLTSSLHSANGTLVDHRTLLVPDGISLLEVKNELFLSYLQNLVMLILLKLRLHASFGGKGSEQEAELQGEVIKKLVELRLYLDKGVRPLESRLKYNIEKVIRAADETLKPTPQGGGRQRRKQANMESDVESSDAEHASPARSEQDMDELSFAPRKNAIMRTDMVDRSRQAGESTKDGIYRPPKITPVTMPITERRETKQERRPAKSLALDEFVAAEMTSAPIAEPSIGSTITHGGRRTKSQKERVEEAERREYEESNYTRLAPVSKKEQSKTRTRQAGGGFGGEEWQSLGAGADRIERLTQKKRDGGRGLHGTRKRAGEDGPRGSGVVVGDAFEKRRRVVARYK